MLAPRKPNKIGGGKNVANRRKVKSRVVDDAHERAKDFLDPTEMDKLLEAAKDGPARRP